LIERGPPTREKGVQSAGIVAFASSPPRNVHPNTKGSHGNLVNRFLLERVVHSLFATPLFATY
jgi:hypothetical protein